MNGQEQELPIVAPSGAIIWNELFRAILDLRESRATGVLTIIVREFAERIRFQQGRVVGIEPTPGAGDLESAARRLRALMGLRQGEFRFEPGPVSSGAQGFDPATTLLSWFDSKKAEQEQASQLGPRMTNQVRPGPRLSNLRAHFLDVFKNSPVLDAAERGLTLAELTSQQPESKPILLQAYAAFSTELIQLANPAQPVVASGISRSEPATASKGGNGSQGELWIGLTTYPGRIDLLQLRAAATEPIVSAEPPRSNLTESADDFVIADSPDQPAIAGLEMPSQVVLRRDRDLAGIAQPATAPSSARAGGEPTSGSSPSSPILPPQSSGSQSLPAAPVVSAAPTTGTYPALPASQTAVVSDGPAGTPTTPPTSIPRLAASPLPTVAQVEAPFSAFIQPPATAQGPAPSSADSERPGRTARPGSGAGANLRAAIGTRPSPPPAAISSRKEVVATGGSSRPVVKGAEPMTAADERRIKGLGELREWLTGIEAGIKENNHYLILQLPENTTEKQIQDQRTSWIKQYHPDLYRRVNIGDLNARLDAAWKAINTAATVLLDKQKRKEYDIFLDRKRKGLPTDVAVIMEAERLFKDGDRLLKGHRYEEALERFKKAMQLNRAEPDFRICRAWAEYMVSKTQGMVQSTVRERSKELISGALENQDSQDRGHYYLAMILKDEGKEREAFQHFQEAVRLNPYNVDAKREVRMISDKINKGDEKKSGSGLFGKRR